MKITEFPINVPEKQARELLSEYDKGIPEYRLVTDHIVSYLENDYREEIKDFKLFMFSVLGFFCIVAVLIGSYLRHFFIKPVRRLREASKEIENGNLAVTIDVKTSDELGELSKTFNAMTTTLVRIFSEAEKRANDILSLNKASNKILGITDTKRLYKAICENVSSLYGLKLVWLGLVEEGSFEVKPVAQAGEKDEYLSSVTVTWDETSTGNGPTGLAIKTRLPQMIPLVDADPSYAPWIAAAHINGFKSVMATPLISSANEVTGAINFYSDKPGFFDGETVELLQVFANQAAAVIDNARMIEGLEKTVRKRTRELEDARLIAESANMSKTNFLANMSHELRTPLNVIIGFSEALASGVYGEIKSEHGEYINRILKSGIQLLSLVNSILELTTIDTGSMELDYTECSIREIVNSSANMFREKAKEHRIDLHVEFGEDLLTFVIDENKVKFILVNLLANALKTTPDDGRVCLSVRKAGDERLKKAVYDEKPERHLLADRLKTKDFLEIAVDDAGPVIPAEERENLFAPFLYEKSPLAVVNEGLRIGLALCKRFIEAHGGEIWIESLPVDVAVTEGNTQACAQITGNRFIFVLPGRPSDDKIQRDEYSDAGEKRILNAKGIL